ncbi:MAG: tRNA (adenosine(37)-N6)-threonylcarbamoyltransferase complex transferase subunit TsaD [Dethiobacter sp.]|jgi:N6-L-threonylcarbamoyladenine synthase|nr:MAG: tRNA (adenosine(37)-N6)-threonylcarbamoyltransferase complex transferase subunit TsaD [Dethiobacter sp.]
MSHKTFILGLETSCDDTSAAVVLNGRTVLSNVVSSQDNFHLRFGGVVPEIASRRHLEIINPVIDEALSKAGITFRDLDGIAVSYGPGLAGSLLIGVSTAKALSFALELPLAAVNHLEGHIYANFLTGATISFPLLCLVVSGGHTSLLYMKGHGQIEILGRTRDDAAGEVFDKIARALGLGFPGGPVIDKLAQQGEAAAFSFPRALMGEEGKLDFSFSGVKTAVLNCIRRETEKGGQVRPADLAAAFQEAVVEALVEKSLMAIRQKREAGQFLLAGGVAANGELRRKFRQKLESKNIELIYPPVELCTDNGAMIASAGYYYLRQGRRASWDLNAVPNLELERV